VAANRNRSARLKLCREHLAAPVPAGTAVGLLADHQKLAAERRCPACQIGALRVVEYLSAEALLTLHKDAALVHQIDSS